MEMTNKTKHHITYRKTCRLCGSSDLRRFLHFDDIPFADEFLTEDTLGTEFLAEIDIYWCAQCKSAQSLHDVEIEEYYQSYHYLPSASALVRHFMETLSQIVVDRFGLKPDDSVIEIGSADGYQLLCFKNHGAKVLGFEPSIELARLSEERGVPAIVDLFTPESVSEIPADQVPAKVVLLSHTFDHLPDPVPILQSIHNILDPEYGLLLIEVHDLQKIVDRRESILFAHEHATFLHTYTMKNLLNRFGFELLEVNFIPDSQMRGNSLLIAASPIGNKHKAGVLPDPAINASLDEWETYVAFEQHVYDSYRGLKAYIRKQVDAGKRIAGYGAMGRGVMTSAMARLDANDLAYICDHNVNFHNLYTPGSHILVSPPERLFDEPVDEVIVFAFGYMDEIREALAPYLEQGGKLTSLLDLI